MAENATWTVSADGKVLTITRKGTDTNGETRSTAPRFTRRPPYTSSGTSGTQKLQRAVQRCPLPRTMSSARCWASARPLAGCIMSSGGPCQALYNQPPSAVFTTIAFQSSECQRVQRFSVWSKVTGLCI